MKKFLLLLIINLSLLFSPPPRQPSDVCGRYVRLGRLAGFNLNPDTYGFLWPSINPVLLLKKESHRQSRPLFILAGTAVGYTLYYLTWPFHTYLRPLYKSFWTGAYPESEMFRLGNFYIALILLNILILWSSLYLLEKIASELLAKSKSAEIAVYCLMVFIASNPVTKTFFWAVHQQMFTLLTPLLCVYILVQFRKSKAIFSIWHLGWLFFAGGLLLLIYGSFLMLLPTLLYGINALYLNNANSPKWRNLLLKNIALILLFLLPTYLWILLLKLRGITYYSFEIDYYRELIWIKDALKISSGFFWKTLYTNSLQYLSTMEYPACFLVIGLCLLCLWQVKFWKTDVIGRDMIFVFFCFFCFYWLLGFYRERLTYILIPLLLCMLVAWGKDLLHQKKMLVLLGSLALIWHLFILFSYGPFC